MTSFTEHKHHVLENRADQDASTGSRESKTHNYRNATFCWGWRVDIDDPIDISRGIYRISGLGPMIRSGDQIIMNVITDKERRVVRLALSDVQYRQDPADM